MKLLAFFLVLVTPVLAFAYPQYQLSKDQTCSSCHVSPAGGGLLTENGLNVAQQFSTYGGDPEALHGILTGPGWFQMSGDFRGAAGLNDDRGLGPAAFPMEAEFQAAVHGHGFTFYGTLGAQSGDGARPQTFVLAREHFLMWQTDENSRNGLFVRVGRFMPVYGLRFAEHNDFTRRFGQVPLFGETYGAAVEYIDPKWEVHATGFVEDPLQDPIERGNGAALYAEARPTEKLAIGVEGRYAKSDDDARTAGGLTAKYYLPDVLLQVEGQVVHQTFAAGGSRNQLVSYLMASWFVHDGWMLDFGLSQYDEDLKVKAVDLEAFDVNLHWFATSHLELLLTNRIQTIALGGGGATSGYSLVQFHYRL